MTPSKNHSVKCSHFKKKNQKRLLKAALPTTAQIVWNRVIKQMSTVEKQYLSKAS